MTGSPPNPATIGPKGTGEGIDRWGELPVHVREIFRTEGGADMPPKYRDFIEAYYRRLNKTRR